MSTPLPVGVCSLGGLFDLAAEQYPDGRVSTFSDGDSLNYLELARRSRVVGGGLLAAGVVPGDPVALLMSSGVRLLQVIGGIATSGAVMVPLPIPVVLGKAYVARLGHVIEDSCAKHAIVDDHFAPNLACLLPGIKTIPFSTLLGADDHDAPKLPKVEAENLAIVQYTSGSTSEPRGVALSHRNVLAGIRALHHGTRVTSNDVICHWLPLSHDMGLFSTLAAVAAGADITISQPQEFIKRPEEWLQRFCALRASILVGPNFGYRYLTEVIAREEVPAYDLSAVRVLLNGAEPIDPGLITTFAKHFGASGLAPTAMTPCYGLAEATLAVTIADLESAASVDWVDRDLLNGVRRAQPVEPDAPNARGVVNCGGPVTGLEVRIVDHGRVLSDRLVGHIEIRGAPVMRGHYRETKPSIHPDGWCSTGDLGYLVDSCLYVTGREKEMLIIGGRNHYPQDIEEALRQTPGLYRGRVVAVVLPAEPSIPSPERIAVLGEVDAQLPHGSVVSEIRRAAAEVLDGAAVDVVLLRRGGLLRTTSGKFQRLLMRRQLLTGTLDGVLAHVPVVEPVARLDREVTEPCLP